MSVVVLHTTESDPGSAEAVARYLVRMGYESHEVFDPSNGDLIQLLPPSQPGKSLVNLPGGVETNNRGGVYQIEIVGRAVDVPGYDDAWYERLRVRLLVVCGFTGTPFVFPLPFQPYPQSYGNNLVRLNFEDWLTVEGCVGHQHVPENDHGDPGALDIERLKEHDMTLDDLVVALGPNARRTGNLIEIQLRDGNWYPWGDVIRYTHQEAQDDSGAGPLTINLSGTAT